MSLETLIVLAVVYFVLGSIARKGKRERAEREAAQPGGTPADNDPAEGELSLEKILKEIERVKVEAERRQAPPPRAAAPKPRFPRPAENPSQGRQWGKGSPERGPMGRKSRIALPEVTDTEERGSLEVEERVISFDEGVSERAGRAIVDQDEGAEAVVRQRIQAAEHRTRAGREAAYQAQQKSDRDAAVAKTQAAKTATDRMRSAIIWREILGPPVGLRD